MEENKKIYSFKVLKIIAIIAIVLTTLFMTYTDIDIISSALSGNDDGLALAYAIVVILFGAFLYAINLIYSLIVLIVSTVYYKKGKCERKTVIFFLIATALPILIYALLVLIPSFFI